MEAFISDSRYVGLHIADIKGRYFIKLAKFQVQPDRSDVFKSGREVVKSVSPKRVVAINMKRLRPFLFILLSSTQISYTKLRF